MKSFAGTRYTNQFYVHMVCHPFEQMAATLDIVCGGVLQRHPGLKVAFLGDPLELTNEDPRLHTLQLRRRGKVVANVSIPTGASVPLPASRAGRYAISVDGRGEPAGYLILVDHPYVARTAFDGTFIMKDVPSGPLLVEAAALRDGKLLVGRGASELKAGAEAKVQLSLDEKFPTTARPAQLAERADHTKEPEP